MFELDYDASFTAEGGSTLRMVVTDNSCRPKNNCGRTSFFDACPVSASVPDLHPLITERIGVQPYPGQFVGLVVLELTEL